MEGEQISEKKKSAKAPSPREERDKFVAFSFAGAPLLIEVASSGKNVFGSGASRGLCTGGGGGVADLRAGPEGRLEDAPEIGAKRFRERFRTGLGLREEMGWLMGFEPTTSGTTSRRSDQLSYSHRRCGL